jgi:dihydroflavonol-4-reductase
VDVRDVVHGAIAASETGLRGERYILSGEWVTVKELAEMAERCTGRPIPRLVAPMWLARMGVPLMTLLAALTDQKPLFTRGSLHTLRHHRHISCAKAAKELFYSPRPLRDSVRDSFLWYEKHSDYLKSYPLESNSTQEYDAVDDKPHANG